MKHADMVDPDQPAADAGVIDQLLAAWEVMSEQYLEGRSALVDLVIGDLVERFAGIAVTICELGCGPGTLLPRLAAALPSARLVGVEIDPLLRRIQELGPATAHPGRIEIVATDLTEPSWVHSVRPTGAVIAVQILHYFQPARLAELLAEVCSLLVPNGVFVHVDHVPRHNEAVLHAAERRLAGIDLWSDWWRTARDTPALADAVRERDVRREIPSAEYYPDEITLTSLFARAGLGNLLVEQRIGASLLTIAGPSMHESPHT